MKNPTNSFSISEKLGISVNSVISFIKKNDIPYRYVSRKYIFCEDEFNKKFFDPKLMRTGSSNKEELKSKNLKPKESKSKSSK